MNIRKLLSIYLLVFLAFPTYTPARISQMDSLQNILNATTEGRQRIDLLLNLCDLSEASDKELPYAIQLFNEAQTEKDAFAIVAPLGVITSHYLETMDKDSLYQYLDKAEVLVKGTDYDGLPTYYKMVYKARVLQIADRENRARVCEQFIEELEANKKHENQYQQAERLFIMGIANFQLMTLTEKIDWNKGLDYWEQAWGIAQTFPLSARKNFSANLCICLISSYTSTKENTKLIDVANSYLNTLDEYYALEEIKKRRPYIYKDMAYTLCYQQMIQANDVIGEKKAHEYYLRYAEFVRSGKGDALLRNKTFFYDISYRYYIRRKEYNKALAYKDSLITLMEEGKSLSAVNTRHYKDKAQLLFDLGNYKEACIVYNQTIAVKDSLTEKEYLEKVGEMQVKYQVDKLELDNANLLAEKRQHALYLATIIIVIIVAFSIYLYLNLKRVKHLQKELLSESAKARESENMKTAFINSMCHEIRTPLNAICGFTELILDDSLEQEEKKSFPDIIRTNTKALTSLLNDLLETANLDSSSDTFQTEETDVSELCRNEMSYLKESSAKNGIEYHLDLPKYNCIIKTHSKYFSLLIRSLLDNANKFTQSGSITLSCQPDPSNNETIFCITDTGCGIPADKYTYVFERFAKLDSFTQGSGLGLYISHIIVKRMNGRIWIDPEYTEGTKLIFVVPNH